MSNLQHRQSKIQEKRKKTPWREFVMEIASWQNVNVYKMNNWISRFPFTGREPRFLVNPKDFWNNIYFWLYDWSFFSSFQQLYKAQEQMKLMQWFENENCDFAEVYGAKNCYLSFSVGTNAENVLYTLMSGINLYNVYNSFGIIENCSNVYSSRVVTESMNIFFSSNIHASNNVWFSTNLLWCSECIFCDWLDNKQYCINNIELWKEEYWNKKKAILFDVKKFDDLLHNIVDKKFINKLSEDVHGGWIVNSSFIRNGYFINNLQNWRNVFNTWSKLTTNNFYDCIDCWNNWDNDLYAAHYTWEHSSYVYCSSSIAASSQIYYSYFLESCSFCLGCIGLKNKSYCILNKQYTKEERYEKVDEIFSQMDADGTLGEFFSATMNSFYFN